MIKRLKRSAVVVTGSCIAILGLILMPVPGPGGTPVFLAGLAILATEVEWAKKFLVRFKEVYVRMSKRKRIALTCGTLIFYIISGVLVWGWVNGTGIDIAGGSGG